MSNDGDPAPAAEGEVIYASVLSTRRHQLSGENPVVGLFRSDDGGDTWRHMGWKQGRTFAAMEASAGRGDTIFVAAGNGIMRTTDGGGFWKIVTGWRITEVQDLTINPRNPAQIYAATPYGIFRSDDLGETWKERNSGLGSKFVASIRVDRTDPHRVFAGTEAGLFVSGDEGDSWTSTAVTTPVRSVRQSPVDAMRWMAGLQDRGVALSSDGGETWRAAAGIIADATIYEAEFHPSDSDRLYAGGWQTGLLRSTDFGASWERLASGLEMPSIHSIAVSRREPGLLLVGTMGGGLYRSRDDGETWHVAAPEVFEAAQVWDLFVAGEQ